MMDDEETLQLSLAVAVQQESVFVRQQSLPCALLVPSPLRTSALDRFPVLSSRVRTHRKYSHD